MNFMRIKDFFHRIKVGFARLRGKSIPYVSSTKRYGCRGEKYFFDELKRVLPFLEIKRNIIIDVTDGNAEIDCLVLYQDKLFAIEVKNWKGNLTETNHGFTQEKIDRWTGEIHSKNQKSPFKQLNRAIYLLKKEKSCNVWVNPVVYFVDKRFEEINTFGEDIWFNSIDDLANFIKFEGKIVYGYNEARKFFDQCASADCLYSKSLNTSLRCIIIPEFFIIQTDDGSVSLRDISHIQIAHHFSYDELYITMKDGIHRHAIVENGKITVKDNGKIAEYSLCKLDYIEVGS